MPRNHGIAMTSGGYPVFRFGIKSVFDALAAPPFVINSGRTLTTQVASYPIPSVTFQALQLHFGHALQRLLHSLDVFQRRMGAIATRYTLNDARFEPSSDQLYASIAGDSILHYLGIVIDDIAKMTPLVFRDDEPSDLFDGFSDLKTRVSKTPYLAPLQDLFASLDCESSWWKLAFRRQQGMRQRVVHYPDLIEIQGEQPEGAITVASQAYLANFVDPTRTVNFEATLRDVLHGLCDWLDRLEFALWRRLTDRAKALNTEPRRPSEPFSMLVPVELRSEPRVIPDTDFLYLPIAGPP